MSSERIKKSAEISKRNHGDTDSLTSYLNSVGKISQAEPAALQTLARSIDQLQQTIEERLSHFGFTALEFCRLLEECFSSGASPEDHFLSSSLRQGQKSLAPDIIETLKEWKNEIQLSHHALEEAFNARKPCDDKRTALSKVMSKFRANGIVTRELYQAAAGYTELNPEHPGQAESRFLMPVDQIQKELSELSTLFSQLEELHTRMAESNLRLVVSLAGKYRECNVPLNDIIQEGNLGLMVAVQRFDVQLGNRFSTYAGWWIKHYMLRAISEQSRVVRLPLHMIQAIQNMNRAEQRFIQIEGREPENNELAELLELPVARVSAMRKMASQSLSLQAPLSTEEDGSSLEELIAPEENSEPWRNYARKLLYDKLYEMLNTLPERERQIIIYRFGLCGEPVLPLCEISARLHLSRERVRQLENKVMNLLRSKEYLKFIDGLSHLDD